MRKAKHMNQPASSEVDAVPIEWAPLPETWPGMSNAAMLPSVDAALAQWDRDFLDKVQKLVVEKADTLFAGLDESRAKIRNETAEERRLAVAALGERLAQIKTELAAEREARNK